MRFENLSLDDGRLDLEDRFPREKNLPLRHGADVAAEFKILEIIEETPLDVSENGQIFKKCDILVGKAQIEDIFNNLFQSAGDQKRTVLRHGVAGQFKRGAQVHLVLEIPGGHGELVKIDFETIAGVHTLLNPQHVSQRLIRLWRKIRISYLAILAYL